MSPHALRLLASLKRGMAIVAPSGSFIHGGDIQAECMLSLHRYIQRFERM